MIPKQTFLTVNSPWILSNIILFSELRKRKKKKQKKPKDDGFHTECSIL